MARRSPSRSSAGEWGTSDLPDSNCCSVALVRPPVDLDPRPEPPARPTADDCCRGGCDPCVFDIYEAELARYEEALTQWRLRHPAAES